MAPSARRLLSRVPFASFFVSRRLSPPSSLRTLSSYSTSTYQSFGFSSISPYPAATSSVEEEKNPVLRQALLKHSPPTLSSRKLQWNSCSFIGTVVSPLKRYNTAFHRFGVFTFLEVNASRLPARHPSSFRILLEVWDELAETAFRHLEKEDLIYAWGYLSLYHKVGDSGKEASHKLVVKKLNFVKRKNGFLTLHDQSNVNEDDRTVASYSRQGHQSESQERLGLWQTFFANPHEWWDNRELKVASPRRSDFTHKHTRETLTLRLDDPPWVRRQLELYDSKMFKISSENFDDWSSII